MRCCGLRFKQLRTNRVFIAPKVEDFREPRLALYLAEANDAVMSGFPDRRSNDVLLNGVSKGVSLFAVADNIFRKIGIAAVLFEDVSNVLGQLIVTLSVPTVRSSIKNVLAHFIVSTFTVHSVIRSLWHFS